MGLLEPVWYEISPYVYSVGSVLTLAHANSAIGVASGALLLTAAALILHKRRAHRIARTKLRAHQTPTRNRAKS